MVEVLNAQKHPSAKAASAQPRNHERARVAEMKRARRAGRETAYVFFFQNFSQSAVKSLSMSGLPNAADVASRMSMPSNSVLK